MFTSMSAYYTPACRIDSQQAGYFPFKRLLHTTTLLLALTAAWTTQPAAAEPSNQWAAGRILVQPRAGLAERELDILLNQHGGRSIKHMEQINVHVVEVPPQAEEAVVNALSHNPHIKFAEKDSLVSPGATVNDPNYSSEWHLPKIQVATAWDSTWGSGVTVAILDSGVDSQHEDLTGKFVTGWNSVDGTTNTTDVYGHGTQVAGTLAASANNSLGVAGVAPNVSLMPIKISNASNGSAYISDIANGLTWAADYGAQVANISYDGVAGDSTILSAAQYMQSKGGVVVVAAGNTGTDPGYSDSPYVIAVSATNSSDTKVGWSSYGSFVDVAAPGTSIWTTVKEGGYAAVNGTSFASPVVAGVVALMKSANPALPPAMLDNILKATAVDLGTAGPDTYYGHGRVNAAAAVQKALQTQVTDTQAPSVSIVSPSGSSTVADVVPVDVNASDDIGVTRVDLYVNGTQVASDATAPFDFSWNTTTLADGDASLVAYAYDAAGNKGTAQTVTVKVLNHPAPADTTPPTPQINNPAADSRVSGIVNIAISATDNVAVSLLNCYVDGNLLGTTSSSSMNCSWNAKKAAAGAHTISATAKDAAGNTATTSIQVRK